MLENKKGMFANNIIKLQEVEDRSDNIKIVKEDNVQ